MRLIDADALKKAFYNQECWNFVIGSIIDNAPTVPLPDFKEGYKQAIIDGKTNFSRPEGEWIKWNFKDFGAFGDWEYKCSNCEKVYGGEYNFCPNCGADMRGEENDQ